MKQYGEKGNHKLALGSSTLSLCAHNPSCTFEALIFSIKSIRGPYRGIGREEWAELQQEDDFRADLFHCN